MLILGILLVFLTNSAESNQYYYQAGDNGTLSCTGTGVVQFWFLRGRDMAITFDSSSFDEISMNRDGSLFFQDVSKEKHDGNHVCVTKAGNEFEAYSVTMNVRPLVPTNLWETRYKIMFLTGFISVIICLVLGIAAFYVHKHRYHRPMVVLRDSRLVEKAYDNAALDTDERTRRM